MPPSDRLDRLYQLLPVIYRQRDAATGERLRALLRVVAEQAAIVEDDISQLYENWFIETCDDWVVPYLADLIGYSPVHEAGNAAVEGGAEDRLRNRILIPRREVANTIANRRRKGTLTLLDSLAGDVAGWTSRAVEFSRLVSVTQAVNHLQPERGKTLDLRSGSALDLIGGPFDTRAHLADVRMAHGRYHPANVGLFTWRQTSFSITRSPASRAAEAGPHAFRFSAMGQDTPLFIRPEPSDVATEFPTELEAPIPIRRRFLEERTVENGAVRLGARAALYGEGRSLAVYVGGRSDPPRFVPAHAIRTADLSDWRHPLTKGQAAIDPVLGRLLFARDAPVTDVFVSYHYGFSAEMGGGEYLRTIASLPSAKVYSVSKQSSGRQDPPFTRVMDAYAQWQADNTGAAIIEIDDSEVYPEHYSVTLPPERALILRAAAGRRPILCPQDKQGDRAGAFHIHTEAGSRVILDGLTVMGHLVEVVGSAEEVRIDHCTLVPGRELNTEGNPKWPEDPSLRISETVVNVSVNHSIVGPIRIRRGGERVDPIRLDIADSIVDALLPDRDALTEEKGGLAHAQLTIARTTVIGGMHVHAILLGENSLWTGEVHVARRQIGCLRFCYVPQESRTPPRFHCQPDGAAAGLSGERRIEEQTRVAPQFESTLYGHAAYCRLSDVCAPEITRGADDESELGAFHDLFAPQRAANLRFRLAEYTPARTQVEVIYAG